MSITCPNCQTVNRDGARFCDNCGTALPVVCPYCGKPLAAPAAAAAVPVAPPLGASAADPQPAAPVGSPLSSSLQARLHQFIPATLLAKLENAQAQGGMIGERRVVTMLFCDVKGSTAAAEHLDPEDYSEIMNGAFTHMIRPVYRYEGTL